MALDKVIAAVLAKENLEPAVKSSLQNNIENALRLELGGQRVYVNKNKRIEPAEVKSAFNGRNVGEIQQRFGISRSRIYEILNDDRL
tara:strand:- start:3851 stop:4111 length:261 start_codon:yes stop_codon:yes gene_type:complete